MSTTLEYHASKIHLSIFSGDPKRHITISPPAAEMISMAIFQKDSKWKAASSDHLRKKCRPAKAGLSGHFWYWLFQYQIVLEKASVWMHSSFVTSHFLTILLFQFSVCSYLLMQATSSSIAISVNSMQQAIWCSTITCSPCSRYGSACSIISWSSVSTVLASVIIEDVMASIVLLLHTITGSLPLLCFSSEYSRLRNICTQTAALILVIAGHLVWLLQ